MFLLTIDTTQLFPSIVFASYMYPKFVNLQGSEFIPDRISRWFEGLISSDDAFRKVYDEVSGETKMVIFRKSVYPTMACNLSQ